LRITLDTAAASCSAAPSCCTHVRQHRKRLDDVLDRRDGGRVRASALMLRGPLTVDPAFEKRGITGRLIAGFDMIP
jgi:hypothetical protein